jgi:uncharacterized protein YceH (UPF0502 family)
MLTPNECRVLGVLVEKAQTTPAQYPLSVNAIVTGSNQKSNRNPILALTEEDVEDALDGLRAKQLAREVMLSGSRVQKHRHIARETLEVTTSELVVLAELMLRGPQTLGELRGRASRMHPLESIDAVTAILSGLEGRDTPLVEAVPPAPGSRAGRFMQLLCPDLHDVTAAPASAPAGGADDAIVQRLAALEAEVERLKVLVASLAQAAPSR